MIALIGIDLTTVRFFDEFRQLFLVMTVVCCTSNGDPLVVRVRGCGHVSE